MRGLRRIGFFSFLTCLGLLHCRSGARVPVATPVEGRAVRHASDVVTWIPDAVATDVAVPTVDGSTAVSDAHSADAGPVVTTPLAINRTRDLITLTLSTPFSPDPFVHSGTLGVGRHRDLQCVRADSPSTTPVDDRVVIGNSHGLELHLPNATMPLRLRAWSEVPMALWVEYRSDDGDDTREWCVTGAANGVVPLDLPELPTGQLQVSAGSLSGSNAPYVLSLSTTVDRPPGDHPPAIPPPAPNTVLARWETQTVSSGQQGCSEGECLHFVLVLEGPIQRRIDVPGSYFGDCTSDGTLSMLCRQGGYASIGVVARGNGNYQLIENRQSDGACQDRRGRLIGCPTERRVLGSFSIPRNLRIVPNPRGT